MAEFYATFGWCLLALAAIFSLALVPRFARRFYPTGPGVLVRLAAPVIFGALAGACFAGVGFEALVLTAVVGTVLVVHSRWKRPTAPAATHAASGTSSS